jgi:cytoskeletal protein CcmA (bactofilin family)
MSTSILTVRSSLARLAVLVVAALVVLAGVTGVAAAEEVRTGGVVVIGAGETVADDLVVTAGSVIVEGRVDGDLTATAGSVVVEGVVRGDVVATAGSVTVAGTVGGDVGAFGGSVLLAEGASVGGNVEAAAGDVRLDGAVAGDALVAAERLTVGPAARLDGELRHDTDQLSVATGSVVGGGVVADTDLGFTIAPAFGVGPVAFDGDAPDVPVVPAWVGALYGLLVNALLGVVLLAVAPVFGRRVADLGATRALRSGGAGLLVAVGVPVALVGLLLTIVGIPLSLAGLVVFLVLLWVASVYGAVVVGTWLLSLADDDGASRWAALAIGLVVVAVVTAIPVVGGLVQAIVTLLGLGAFALAVRGESGRDDDTGPAGSEAGRPAA